MRVIDCFFNDIFPLCDRSQLVRTEKTLKRGLAMHKKFNPVFFKIGDSGEPFSVYYVTGIEFKTHLD